MFGSARQGNGSSPQSALPEGCDVRPRMELKSDTMNTSPASNASVTVNTEASFGVVNVQAGASSKPVGVPELGVQNAPFGSAGSQPVANPIPLKANSRNEFEGIAPARLPVGSM